MRAVELFSGIGLSSIGLVEAGVELVGACELHPLFVKAFNAQSILPPVAISSDIDDYEIPPCDLLSAGPVCKAFSPGATLFGTAGSDDKRNTFPHLFRAIERSDPRYVLIENSYGLQRFKGYLGEILEKLKNMGYHVIWDEVDCFDYGVPQHRRRVVILGAKDGPWYIFKPDQRNGPMTVGDCMRNPPPTDKLPLTRPMSEGEKAYWNRDPRHAKKHPPLNLWKPASTVVGNYKRGVPYGVVEIPSQTELVSLHMCNPRLAARLQGIPDTYNVDAGSRTRMLEGIGNGFPPPVVKYLVEELIRSRG
jgi:site-specific DNA-cytosine methylase